MFKKTKKESDECLILEYLIVFQKSGLPILSKCFGDFCGVLMVDDTLLSGFLSAMTTMPSFFSTDEKTLNSIEMGFTKLLFSHTLPSGHVICLGFNKNSINKKNQQKIDNLFDKINNFIEKDQKDVDWSLLTTEEIEPIIDKLLSQIINPWVHLTGNYTKEHKENCPMCIDGPLFRGKDEEGIKEPIWKRWKELYAYGRKLYKDQIPGRREHYKKKGLIEE